MKSKEYPCVFAKLKSNTILILKNMLHKNSKFIFKNFVEGRSVKYGLFEKKIYI